MHQFGSKTHNLMKLPGNHQFVQCTALISLDISSISHLHQQSELHVITG